MKDLDAGLMGRSFFYLMSQGLESLRSDAASRTGARAASVDSAVGKVLGGPNGLACRLVQ